MVEAGGRSGAGVGYNAPGGGGSSFISGYEGCNAIASNSTQTNIVHSNTNIHYSGYYFTSASIIDGITSMPSVSGSTETGHSGNGYARITCTE